MQSPQDWPRIVRLLARIAAAGVLLVLLAPLAVLLTIELGPLQYPGRLSWPADGRGGAQLDTPRWSALVARAERHLGRSFHICIEQSRVSVHLTLNAPMDGALAGHILRGDVERDEAAFVEAVFGQLTLNSLPLRADEWILHGWHVESDHLKLDITASREIGNRMRLELETPAARPRARPVSMLVKLAGARVVAVSPILAAASVGEISIASPSTVSLEVVALRQEAGKGGKESRQVILQRLGKFAERHAMGACLYGLAVVLPLLLFLLVCRAEAGAAASASTVVQTTKALLIFHGVLYFAIGTAELADEHAALTRLAHDLASLRAHWFGPDGPLPLRAGVQVLVAGLLSGLTAVIVGWPTGPAARHGSVRWRSAAAGLVVLTVVLQLSVLFGALVAPESFARYPRWSFLVAGLVTATTSVGVVWCFCWVCGYAAVGERAGLGYAAVSSVAATLVILVPSQGGCSSLLWEVIVAVLGTLLVVSVMRRMRVLGAQAWPALASPGLLAALGAIFVAFLAAFPVQDFVESSAAGAHLGNLLELGRAVDELIVVIWVAGVVWFLSSEGRRGIRPGPLARRLGLLAAAAVMFSSQTQWAYVPVPFLLGWATFELFLVAPGDHERLWRLGEWSKDSKRQELIDRVLDLNAAERALGELRETQRRRLVAGEVSFQDYDRSLETRGVEMRHMRAQRLVEGQEPGTIALMFAPYPNAWRNGVHGFAFALLLAAPWIVAGLWQILLEPNPDDHYPMWWLLLRLLTLPVKWGAYGFLLGYFFPLVRGRSGVAKGFYLFAASMVAILPMAALGIHGAEGWKPIIIWVAQVLLHCLLLGLVAFDFVSLRRSGYRDWRLLFAVHDVPAIGASLSSILVALGTIIAAAVTSQGGSIINAMVAYFVPSFQR